MKRIVCLIIVIMLSTAVLAGCAVKTETAAPEPTETPEPTEAPEPPFKIWIVSDGDVSFFEEGIKSVIGGSVDVIKTDSGIENGVKDAEEHEATCIIAYVNEEAADVKALDDFAAQEGKSVLVFDKGANTFSNAYYFGYDTSGAQQQIFDTLMTLPNHDTPVRLFGMFTSETTEAAQYYANGVNDGKIFDKGTFVEDMIDTTPDMWISDMLDGYYPGMLDAIYAENERLAQIAFDALNTLERDDIEIVTLYNEIPAEQMKANPYVLTAEVCPNTYYIGAYLANCALKIKNKEEIETVEFTPDVIYVEMLDGGLMTETMKQSFPFQTE